MRIRQKEIRQSRKREESALKVKIKEAREVKKAVAPARARSRRANPPAS